MLLLFCCLSEKMAKIDQPRRGWFREGRFQPPIPCSIVTEADTWEELRANVREAVLCHFDEGKAPAVIRLHRVLDDSTTNLATSARCLGGNALNCLIRACAVMPQTNHHHLSLASGAHEWAVFVGGQSGGAADKMLQ
jgi:hypothetical protein